MAGLSSVEKLSTSDALLPNIGGKRNDLLVGVVVSRWDNIVGPQCVYLWTEERTSIFHPVNLPSDLSRLIKYVTEHTVDHQDIDGDFISPAILRSTLCIVRELSLAYLSVSIRVPVDPEVEQTFGFNNLGDRNRPASSIPHAVAILANLQYLPHFLLLRPVMINWLSEFAPKIAVLLCKSQLQSSMINSWCAELCKTMASLKTCWGQDGQINGGTLQLSTDTEESIGGEYLPPDCFSKSMLETLLVSYLTTYGSSIIVGDDNVEINQVIRFLLCFNKDPEIYCSKYVLPTLPDTFMKGLFVQGLMLGEIGANSISYNQIASNKYPFTHIEINKKAAKIKQSHVLNQISQREALLREELTALWNSTALGTSTLEPFPTLVKEGSSNTFVSQFLEDIRLLQPDKRYVRLLLFKRSLHAKAIALITYLESIRLKPQRERSKMLKTICQALGFEESEYLVVRATAEKIRPGVQAIIRTKFYS